MNLAFVLIGLTILGTAGYFLVKFIRTYGFMDVVTIIFIFLALVGITRLIRYTGEGSHV